MLASIKEMEKNVVTAWKPDGFYDFGFGENAPYRDLFCYNNPYANPLSMEISVGHKSGGETLVIYGPNPETLFHQCVMPVKENADAAFCCAVHELNPEYEVRQYSL